MADLAAAHVRLLTPPHAVAIELHGVVSALWFSALVLFAARRCRGLTFPKHPGEVVWVAMGFQETCELVEYVLYYVVGSVGISDGLALSPLAAPVLLSALLFRYRARRVTARRWRFFLNFSAIASAVCVPMIWLPCFAEKYLRSDTALRVSIAVYWAGVVVTVLPWLVYPATIYGDCKSHAHAPWTHWVPAFIIPFQLAAWLFESFVFFLRTNH